MKHRIDDAPPIPLRKRPLGIDAFRVEGRVGTERVHAHWDGRWLLATRTLYEHAMVAIAVDQAFAEAGIGLPRVSSGEFTPEKLMLALVACCDRLDVAEYELKGHRRVDQRVELRDPEIVT